MSNDFYTALASRRTFYGISNESMISDDKIKELIEQAVLHTPSAFNSQSARIILLLGDHHKKLWDITKEALRKIVPSEQFSQTEERINSFQNGYGTILFYEDQGIIETFQQKFPLYKDNFPSWSQQASGMHQYVIWTALEIEGFGVSLQHYTELIEKDVSNEWEIPNEWKLIGQMPFGKPTMPPNEKQYEPLENRVKVYR